jgi:hypothetical protein
MIVRDNHVRDRDLLFISLTDCITDGLPFTTFYCIGLGIWQRIAPALTIPRGHVSGLQGWA